MTLHVIAYLLTLLMSVKLVNQLTHNGTCLQNSCELRHVPY